MKTRILIAFATLLLLGSCKTKEVVSYIERYHETTKIDSVYQYLKDTVVITQRNETVFVTNYKTKIDYKFKYINKTDTVRDIKTEYKVKEVKVPTVVKKTRWISWIDWILIAVIVLYLLFFRRII